MKILVVKLTSMGDVLHLMPALSDLQQHIPSATVDWLVEDSFTELPNWHPIVNRVIPVSTRRWRKLKYANLREFFAFIKVLRSESYDVIVDAQGLMKSAVFARLAKCSERGFRAGFSGDSIKESPAAHLYKKRISVPRQQHAIKRLRALLAGAFDYSLSADDASNIHYALQLPRVKTMTIERVPSILLLHGTTWSTKHLPNQVWRDLAQRITGESYRVLLCWGNTQEQHRAQWIAQDLDAVQVLPKSSLSELVVMISRVDGVIAVDTGLGHMAAALGVPSVSVYGSTDASLTGALGQHQRHLQSDYVCSPCLLKRCDKLSQTITDPPCYQTFSAQRIWQELQALIRGDSKTVT